MRLGKVDSTHVIKRVNSVTAEMVIQSLRYGIKLGLKWIQLVSKNFSIKGSPLVKFLMFVERTVT